MLPFAACLFFLIGALLLGGVTENFLFFVTLERLDLLIGSSGDAPMLVSSRSVATAPVPEPEADDSKSSYSPLSDVSLGVPVVSWPAVASGSLSGVPDKYLVMADSEMVVA